MSSVTSERFMPSGKTFSSELSGGEHLNLGFDMDFLFLKGHFLSLISFDFCVPDIVWWIENYGF